MLGPPPVAILRHLARPSEAEAPPPAHPPVCECCEHAPSVELHHIVAMARRPDLAAEETNALMLCRRCHALARNRGATLREMKAHAAIAGVVARRLS